MLRKAIMEKLKEKGYEVMPTDKVDNGITHKGISIGNGIIRPTIYIDNYNAMNDIDWIVNDIIVKYESVISSSSMIDTNFKPEDISNWNYAKDKLQLCIQKKGKEDIIKRDFLDLEQYVRIIINKMASTKVNNALLEMWGVSEDEVFKVAWDNTKPNLGVVEKDEDGGLTISNKDNNFGSVAICKDELLTEIADYYDRDFIIIPINIHQCFIMYDGNLGKDAISRINDRFAKHLLTQPPELLLSTHIYKYIKDTKEIISL